ncbi:unnamed protein product [Coffea canephora]|uniref:DH200=94 genomic scaffold, scaffold_159 n=1 Tax=Coffea canephora TaxID=49390 RepID=A0A068VA28_COFCA|nr:unnamed protein product [Coffea canephora]
MPWILLRRSFPNFPPRLPTEEYPSKGANGLKELNALKAPRHQSKDRRVIRVGTFAIIDRQVSLSRVAFRQASFSNTVEAEVNQ